MTSNKSKIKDPKNYSYSKIIVKLKLRLKVIL